jgi:quinol-cytochrome oxidoreductase complex cytochrome b subunit
VFFRLSDIKPYSLANYHVIDYPTPLNINYFWGFGFLAIFCLVTQIITGICLAMHYTPDTALAFFSIEHIMRNVNCGWLLRYIHANGASMFFVVVYIHIGRGLYFKSFRNTELWFSGVTLFFLMMATGFLGYVLPWGQMSFWGATVITNLTSAIPFIGSSIAIWLWGGFSVDNATLVRFFSIHYLLPFIITGLVVAHITLLHTGGSTNPLGVWKQSDYIKFYPYFVIKDFFGLMLYFMFFFIFLFFYPNYLGHSDNYIMANSMVTPSSIVPEWYFLPYYAILRSIPDKLGGVIFMVLSIALLFILPFIPSGKISTKFNKLDQIFFWFFVGDVFLLGWLGGQAAEEPFITISRISTLVYFFYFFSSIISYHCEKWIIKIL